MNLTNWLLIFMVSLLGLGTVGYLLNIRARRRNGLWNAISLTLASLICATMLATLFVQSPLVATIQATDAGNFTCLGTPALVRAGDPIAITGQGEPDSTITVWQAKTTLASTTIAMTGDYALEITVTTPGVQTVLCQVESATGQVQSITLSFLVIGQAAALPTTPAPATNTPMPTATKPLAPTAPPTKTLVPTAPPTSTNTPAPTNTNTPEPTVAPPVVDLESIPAEILPGETFRLQGTAASSARVRVTINDRVVGGAVSGTDGGWRTTIGFTGAGTYTVTAQLVENDTVVAESEPVSVTVLAPAPTNTPEPTATNTAAPTNTPEPTNTSTNTPAPTNTNTPEPTNTATNTPAPTNTNTPEPTNTSTNTPAPTNVLEPTATVVSAAAATIEPSQPISDTVAAPAALPGTGSDFSQGVPWVVMLLLIGAALTLGIGRLSKKPTA